MLKVQTLKRVGIFRGVLVMKRSGIDRAETLCGHFEDAPGHGFVGRTVVNGGFYRNDRTGLRLKAEEMKSRTVRGLHPY